ncbi:hypothetical protein [Microcoleus sp. herbarium2]|uniref:hypothetical protein n=1 Tax=Microcoleus sp. herbarium2 TaxID=3055433 RepID=UPI002FD58298
MPFPYPKIIDDRPPSDIIISHEGHGNAVSLPQNNRCSPSLGYHHRQINCRETALPCPDFFDCDA